MNRHIYCEVDSRTHFDALLLLAIALGVSHGDDFSMLSFVYNDSGPCTKLRMKPDGIVVGMDKASDWDGVERVSTIEFITAMYDLNRKKAGL